MLLRLSPVSECRPSPLRPEFNGNIGPRKRWFLSGQKRCQVPFFSPRMNVRNRRSSAVTVPAISPACGVARTTAFVVGGFFGPVMERPNSRAQIGGHSHAVDDQTAACVLFVSAQAGVLVEKECPWSGKKTQPVR